LLNRWLLWEKEDSLVPNLQNSEVEFEGSLYSWSVRGEIYRDVQCDMYYKLMPKFPRVVSKDHVLSTAFVLHMPELT